MMSCSNQVADLPMRVLETTPPLRQVFFVFMQFLENLIRPSLGLVRRLVNPIYVTLFIQKRNSY